MLFNSHVNYIELVKNRRENWACTISEKRTALCVGNEFKKCCRSEKNFLNC